MHRPKIVAHCVVRNEERWIWYAITSVIDYVDEIMVWDTGSDDKTVQIVKSISNPRLKFKQVPLTSDETALSQVRQRMLEQTTADWLMILDGDEIWSEESMRTVVNFVDKEGKNHDSIVVRTLNCVGDVFHISPPEAGRYKFADKVGHYNLRVINLNRVPGLHVANPPGELQSYYCQRGLRIQDRNSKHIAFLDVAYLHTTHLRRTSFRKHEVAVFWRGPKRKLELGQPLPVDFSYPKCLYYPTTFQSDIWQTRSLGYTLMSVAISPFKYLKHQIEHILL